MWWLSKLLSIPSKLTVPKSIVLDLCRTKRPNQIKTTFFDSQTVNTNDYLSKETIWGILRVLILSAGVPECQKIKGVLLLLKQMLWSEQTICIFLHLGGVQGSPHNLFPSLVIFGESGHTRHSTTVLFHYKLTEYFIQII